MRPRREQPLQRQGLGAPPAAVVAQGPARAAGPRSPAPLVVEEEHEEELLVGLRLHVLPDLQHVQRRGRDGDPVVVAGHARHLRVDDLQREGARSRRRPRTEERWAGRDASHTPTPRPRHPDPNSETHTLTP